LQGIAQTHYLLNALSPDILKHLIKSETFAMYIGNNRKTHDGIPFPKSFLLMTCENVYVHHNRAQQPE
jgi:hypothetical protein